MTVGGDRDTHGRLSLEGQAVFAVIPVRRQGGVLSQVLATTASATTLRAATFANREPKKTNPVAGSRLTVALDGKCAIWRLFAHSGEGRGETQGRGFGGIWAEPSIAKKMSRIIMM